MWWLPRGGRAPGCPPESRRRPRPARGRVANCASCAHRFRRAGVRGRGTRGEETPMRRTGLRAVCAVLLSALILAGGALASSVHLKGGAKAKPSSTDNGLTLTVASALAGLGNADVLIRLSA